VDLWAYSRKVVLDFSRSGKPVDNAHAEAFNARFRAECLNEHWFLNLDDARAEVESWRVDYNEVRLHNTTVSSSSACRPTMALPAP
jgi:putative transposase